MANFSRSFKKKISDQHGGPKPKKEKLKRPSTPEEEAEYNRKVKANKKGARGCYHGGLYFASTWERDYWETLKAEKAAGMYRDIKRQVRIPIKINGVLMCTYVADAVVYLHDGTYEVRDTKSTFTRKDALYQLKKKLLAVLYGIYIKEVLRTYKKN
jgi:hypothetical protein